MEQKNPEKPTLGERARNAKHKFFSIYDRIWSVDPEKKVRGAFGIFAWIWRVAELAISGTIKNAIPLQAAALTYYTLMALAPFVMLVLMIFAFVMDVKGENAVMVVQERMAEMMQLVLPDPKEDEQGVPANQENLELPEHQEFQENSGNSGISGNSGNSGNATAPADPTQIPRERALENLAPQLQEFSGMLLNNTMQNSGSSGTIGVLLLLILAVFMIARVEDAFNLVWNVKKARSWPRRFLVYFVVILLGGALFAFTMSMLSVSAVMKSLNENALLLASNAECVPVASTFVKFMTSAAPSVLAFVLMTLIFACLNRYLPYVEVLWKPAIIGGAFVSICFIVCGKMATLFVGKISEFNSVYGNLSVIFILMFGLYLGWMFLLIGGEVAYAIQNARYFKNVNRRWAELSPRSKQNAYFACLFAVYAGTVKNNIGPTAEEISNELAVPANLIRECLATLIDLKLVVPVATEVDAHGQTRYNSGGCVAKMTILELRHTFDNLRTELEIGVPASARLARKHFDASFNACNDQTTIQALFDEHEELDYF